MKKLTMEKMVELNEAAANEFFRRFEKRRSREYDVRIPEEFKKEWIQSGKDTIAESEGNMTEEEFYQLYLEWYEDSENTLEEKMDRKTMEEANRRYERDITIEQVKKGTRGFFTEMKRYRHMDIYIKIDRENNFTLSYDNFLSESQGIVYSRRSFDGLPESAEKLAKVIFYNIKGHNIRG